MISSSMALAALGAGCQPQTAQQGNEEPVAVTQQAGTLDDLAGQCGLTCPKTGIVDGNASISGVASVDSFFQAVLDFQAKANNVSAGIDAQLAAIKATLASLQTPASRRACRQRSMPTSRVS